MNRRGMLGAILGAGFAPAVIGSGILMPVSKKIMAEPMWTVAELDPRGRISVSSTTDDQKVAAMVALIRKECNEAFEYLKWTDPSYNTMKVIEEYSKAVGAVVSVHVNDSNSIRYDVKTDTRLARVNVEINMVPFDFNKEGMHVRVQ